MRRPMALLPLLLLHSAAAFPQPQEDPETGVVLDRALPHLCAAFAVYVAEADGCSICLCAVDARMDFCNSALCENTEGKPTDGRCVANSLYRATDGCNWCQCNEWGLFSNCSRQICSLSDEELQRLQQLHAQAHHGGD